MTVKKTFGGFIVCLCLLTAAACRNELTEQLHGKWQLRSIEQTGRVIGVDTVWYNFQSESLFMYQLYWVEKDTFLCAYGYRTQPESNVIRLELIAHPYPLNVFLPFTDWDESVQTFYIERMDRNRLILRKEDKTYTFNRY
ncbi:MAG: lipocalin-like domain-containing protein [Tannerella sp.]|jgi:hypothetical protein|nr:lipocalin-like domain-containing protein [Tannerella sp.]